MVDSVDVLVVGGGPAGLSAAAAAAAAGASALVLERRPEIGHPVHTSGATAVETVERFGIPQRLWHPVTRARFVSSVEEAFFEYLSAPLCIIDVRGTYRWLADRAVGYGARVETATRFVSPILDGSRVLGANIVSRGEPRTIRSRVLVDASGYRAAVSKRAGLHAGFERFGVGYEYELSAPSCRQDEVVIIVGERYAPAGYGWVFPWGNGRVRVGVGVHHSDTRADPQHHLDLLMAEAREFGVDLSGAEIVEHHVGLVPAERVPSSLVSDGVISVGDAAGQATLVAGEGIRVSLLAGDLAGRTAGLAVRSGDTGREALLPYERSFREQFGRQLRVGYALNRQLARLDDAGWDRKVRLLRRLPPAALPLLLQSEFTFPLVRELAAAPSTWLPLARSVGAAILGR